MPPSENLIMAAKEMFPEPSFLECGFGELEHKVIAREVCCLCGSCIAFCPRIAQKESRPALVEYDPLCGLCYAYCPRTFLDMSAIEKKIYGRTRNAGEALGIHRKASAAKALPLATAAQDGGVVTALLIHALDSGTIDCAVVTGRNNKWEPVPIVATTAEEIAAAAGTKYTISPSVTGVQMAMDQGFSKIGFVGTPCQIQALRKVQFLEEPYQFGQDKIALLVGLFCMENFQYDLLMEGLVEKTFGMKPEDVVKFQISKGMFKAQAKGGEKEVPLAETDPFVWKGCGPCFDFASELADIAVGSVGSPSGWSTVLVRTDIGEALFEGAQAAGKIESKAVTGKGMALCSKLAGEKAARFQKNVEGMAASGITFDVLR